MHSVVSSGIYRILKESSVKKSSKLTFHHKFMSHLQLLDDGRKTKYDKAFNLIQYLFTSFSEARRNSQYPAACRVCFITSF